MNTELTSISSCIKELKISVTKEEFDKKYYQELKVIQAKIRMPGFRPGRVPVKLIESQYGPSIKMETRESIANDSFKKFLENNDINVLGTPAFSDLKENEDGSQVYTIKFETIPDFELKDYKSLEIFEPYHKVTDEEVEKALNEQANRLGEKIETDIVADYNHIVTVDRYISYKDTKEPTNDSPTEMLINMQEDMIGIRGANDTMDLRDKFLNKKASDEVDFIGNAETERFVIKKIEKNIPCEINDEFVKLASKDKFDNLEDYKQEIGFSLQKFWDNKTRELMEEQIVSKVTELHDDIEVPDALTIEIKKQIIKSNKQQYPDYSPDEEKNKEYLDIISQKVARVQIVQDKIIKKEKIEVEDYDYENFVDDFLAKNSDFSQYNITKDVLIKNIKTDENMKGTLLRKKYVDFLLDFTKTNEIDYNEYINKNLNNKLYTDDISLMEEKDEIGKIVDDDAVAIDTIGVDADTIKNDADIPTED